MRAVPPTSAEVSPNAGAGGNVQTPSFVQKVYDMVEECHRLAPQIAQWDQVSPDGGFKVFEVDSFAGTLFQKYQFVNRSTGHPIDFTSFQRQLNGYSFTVRSDPNSPPGTRLVRHRDGLFQRNRQDLLPQIRKRSAEGGTGGGGASGGAGGSGAGAAGGRASPSTAKKPPRTAAVPPQPPRPTVVQRMLAAGGGAPASTVAASSDDESSKAALSQVGSTPKQPAAGPSTLPTSTVKQASLASMGTSKTQGRNDIVRRLDRMKSLMLKGTNMVLKRLGANDDEELLQDTDDDDSDGDANNFGEDISVISDFCSPSPFATDDDDERVEEGRGPASSTKQGVRRSVEAKEPPAAVGVKDDEMEDQDIHELFDILSDDDEGDAPPPQVFLEEATKAPFAQTQPHTIPREKRLYSTYEYGGEQQRQKQSRHGTKTTHYHQNRLDTATGTNDLKPGEQAPSGDSHPGATFVSNDPDPELGTAQKKKNRRVTINVLSDRQSVASSGNSTAMTSIAAGPTATATATTKNPSSEQTVRFTRRQCQLLIGGGFFLGGLAVILQLVVLFVLLFR